MEHSHELSRPRQPLHGVVMEKILAGKRDGLTLTLVGYTDNGVVFTVEADGSEFVLSLVPAAMPKQPGGTVVEMPRRER